MPSIEFLQNMQTLAMLINSTSLIIGVGLFLAVIFQLKKHGESKAGGGQSSLAAPLVLGAVACLMISLPSILSVILNAMWGTDSPLAYVNETGYAVMPNVIVFIRVVGLGVLVRGLVMLSKSGHESSQSQGHFGKSMVYLFSGLLLIHIMGTYHIVHEVFSSMTQSDVTG